MLLRNLLIGIAMLLPLAGSGAGHAQPQKGAPQGRLLAGDEMRRVIEGYVLITPPVETAPWGEGFYPSGRYHMFADWIPPAGRYTINGRRLCVYMPGHETRCRQLMQTSEGLMLVERIEGRTDYVPVVRRPINPENY